MKKILLTALALLMGTFMYAQRDAAKVPGASPSKDVKTEAVLSAVKAPANTNSERTTKGDSQLTYNSTAVFNGSIGTGGTGTYFEWAAVFRPSMYSANDNYVTSVDFYSYQAATYTVSIYEGESATSVPTELIYQHQYNVTDANQWVTLSVVNSVVAIDQTKSLWVAVGTDQVAYPACYSNEVLSTTDCCMMYFQNEWLPITELGDFQIQPWMIVANTTSDEPGITCDAISEFPYLNDFENFLDEVSCWVSIDNDGDGQDWITGTTQSGQFNGYNSSTGLVSKSYDYDGAGVSYHADNYLLSPEFVLPADYMVTLSWYAKSSYSSYPDHYEVMIAPNGSTSINDFVSVYNENGPSDWTQRSADISAYAGTTVRVVFHHQDFDKYWILIDNLGIETTFDCSSYGYPFVENFENGLDCWGNFDEDGDGNTWQLAAGNQGNGAKSVSWGSGIGSLTPDNWLVSPEITIPSGLDEVTLAWKVKSTSTTYTEHYGVYVSTTGNEPSDFTTQIYEGQSPSASGWIGVTVDMTAYVGQTVNVAFRHYNSADRWDFTIDEISIKSPLQCTDITEFPYFNDFNNFLDEKHCWIDIDNDGDGYGWFTDTELYGTSGFGVGGSNCLVSQSYDNSTGARNADNYLLSPEVVLPANSTVTLSWYEQSQDGDFPDSYEVMIAPNGSTDISDFVSIYAGTAANPWTELSADLSAYAGTTVRVVFHHQSSDCYILEIDNMGITVEAAPEPSGELTIYADATATQRYTPVYTYYGDTQNSAAQFVVPASLLTDMVGGQITSMKFYTNPGQEYQIENISGPTYAGYMTEVQSETMSTFIDFNSATNIFNGNISLTDDCLIIDLDTPYTYNGGNLAIAFVCTQKANYCSVYYYSQAVTGGSIYRNSGSGANVQNYIPKTTFTYTGGGPQPDECDPITEFPYFNDFEDFLTNHDCWVSIDADGDGQDWITGTQVYWEQGVGVDGSHCIASESYNDVASASYNADNYIVSPKFELPADETVTLSWQAMGVWGWGDFYEVMIAPNGSTNISDFVSVYSEASQYTWTERSVDISAYAGTTVRVVFRHNDNDLYAALIDNMGITLGGSPEPDECDPITEFPYFNDFEDFNTNHDCWISIDNDGDGRDWFTGTSHLWGNGFGVDESNCLVSESYLFDSGISLDADNYLLSPEFVLPAGEDIKLSWYAQAQDPDYPDSYEVLIAPNGSTNISDFVSVYGEVGPNPWTLREADISAYAGTTVRVVFHHQDNDMFFVEIDNMSITLGGSPEPDECAITTFPYFNDFEDFNTNHDCWISIDNDNDGEDWITGTAQSGMFNGYNSSTGLISKSYDYDAVSGISADIDADNYLLTPEFVLPANKIVTLSWYVSSAYGPNWPDWYEVMIAPNGSTDINDFVQVLNEDGPSDWEQRTVDISAYAGTTVRVVFHHQDYAQYWIEIDNLGITVEGDDPEPGDCDPITTFPYFNDFENFLAEKDCWISIDNDGDGHDWFTGTEDWWDDLMGFEDTHALLSESYSNDLGAFNADNYLLSPEFELPATNNEISLSWLSSGSGDYYEVMVAPNGSTDINDFVALYDGTGSFSFSESMVDLSAYAGTTIRVVFHHQDTDNFVVIIDNMSITLGGSPEPGGFPYLETFDVNGMDDWSNLDEDGDGRMWELAAGHTGMGAKSVSWESSYGKASYDPDNWLISPAITIPATAGQENPVQLSWYVQSGSNSYPEHYGVYISTTGDQPADFTTQLYEGISPSTSWTQLTVDLNAYIGQTIRVAFRHYDSYDKWHFIIDDIEIKEYEEPEPVECDPITDFPYLNEFEDFLTNHDCWIDIDNDGDGQTWITGTTNYGTMGWGVNSSNCLVSQSYDNNIGSFNADNYLVSPEFELPTTVEEALILSWYEQSQDASYPDSYEVMIAPNGSTNISDFVSIYSGVAANPWTERTFDISSYAGQTIRVVFHHQSYDCYMLEIDNLSIYDGQGPEPVTCDPITDFPYFNDFENFLAEKECWISIDNDGDGRDWFTGTSHLWGNGLGVDESNCLVSESYLYDSGISLDADNYLLSPEFVLPAGEDIKLSWYAQAQDPDYPDSYEVLIAPNGSTNISDFVSVYGEVSPNPWAERNADISAYAGQTIRVVFHHQDYDMFFVEIDNLSIEVYTGVEENNSEAVAVYPNPVKNTMTLTGVEVGTEVRIYDLAGNTVMSFVYEGRTINVENLANGVYVLRANDSMIKIVK